jgi:bacterioferritin
MFEEFHIAHPGFRREKNVKIESNSIDHLNQALKNKLTAINQTFIHARMFRNWGLTKLDAHEYQNSKTAMKHADSLINRIFFLEGLPNLQNIGKLLIGEDAREIFENDLKLLTDFHQTLQKAIEHCESASDFVSRDLLDALLESEEEHIDWLETQLGLIDKVGLENYLQSQM